MSLTELPLFTGYRKHAIFRNLTKHLQSSFVSRCLSFPSSFPISSCINVSQQQTNNKKCHYWRECSCSQCRIAHETWKKKKKRKFNLTKCVAWSAFADNCHVPQRISSLPLLSSASLNEIRNYIFGLSGWSNRNTFKCISFHFLCVVKRQLERRENALGRR